MYWRQLKRRALEASAAQPQKPLHDLPQLAGSLSARFPCNAVAQAIIRSPSETLVMVRSPRITPPGACKALLYLGKIVTVGRLGGDDGRAPGPTRLKSMPKSKPFGGREANRDNWSASPKPTIGWTLGPMSAMLAFAVDQATRHACRDYPIASSIRSQ